MRDEGMIRGLKALTFCLNGKDGVTLGRKLKSEELLWWRERK